MNRLALLQRIHRRIALLGGSHTHPDGGSELDFKAAAGVDHYRDSDELKAAKVDRNAAKEAKMARAVGALAVGAGVCILTCPHAPSCQLWMAP